MGVTNLLEALNICVDGPLVSESYANLTAVNYHQLAGMVSISLSGHGLSVFTPSSFEFPPLHPCTSHPPSPNPTPAPSLSCVGQCMLVNWEGRREGGCGLLVIN